MSLGESDETLEKALTAEYPEANVRRGAGFVLARAHASPELGAFTGAAIEGLFAASIFVRSRRVET